MVELATHLGDGATVAAIAVLVYWFAGASRRVRPYVLGVGLVALAVSTGLKGTIARERPDPEVLTFAPETHAGFSFPSAHALGSAAIFSMLMITLSVGRPGHRILVGATVIATVMLSRVVLGVHYVGDVFVGALVGLAIVAVMFRAYPDVPDPQYAFALAFVIATVAYALGARRHSMLVMGASLGAAATWRYVDATDPRPAGAAIVVLGVLILPWLFVLRGATAVFEISHLTQLIGYAIATAGVLVVPVVAERMNDWPPVVWLQTLLPFEGRTIDFDPLGS